MADIALHDLGGEARAREIVPQAREALCARIDGGDVPSRRGELHRLAARCGAQVEDAASLAIAQKARRKAGREILHPPAARAEAWHIRDRSAAWQATMPWCQSWNTAPFDTRPLIGKAKVDRRRRTPRRCGRVDHRVAPLPGPAFGGGRGKLCRRRDRTSVVEGKSGSVR